MHISVCFFAMLLKDNDRLKKLLSNYRVISRRYSQISSTRKENLNGIAFTGVFKH